MKKRQYYRVGEHLFSVSKTLDPSYEPFHTGAGRSIFDVKIKMDRYHGKLKNPIIRQVEDDVEIRAGRIGFKFYFEFRLFKRRVVIPTERKSKPLIISSLDFFYAPNWRVFGVLVIVLAFLDS